MRALQYFLLLVVLVDSSASMRLSNAYYSLLNRSSTSALIDYMKTLYEQEKQLEEFSSDYNLIRALAPRLGKIRHRRTRVHRVHLCDEIKQTNDETCALMISAVQSNRRERIQ